MEATCENDQIIAIDTGTRVAHFLPQNRRYSSLASYTVSLGLYQNKRVESLYDCTSKKHNSTKCTYRMEIITTIYNHNDIKYYNNALPI